MCISVFYLAFLKMPRVTFLLLLLLFIKINGFVLQKSNNSVENEGDAGSLRIIRSSCKKGLHNSCFISLIFVSSSRVSMIQK